MGQDTTHLFNMLGVDASPVIILVEPFKAVMPKPFYHALTVKRQLSFVKLFFTFVTFCPVIGVLRCPQSEERRGRRFCFMDKMD